MFDGFQIIYVEDDASVRNSLTQTLELAGFTVQACATAEAALPYLTPDLRGIVVSDVRMPGTDGLQLLDKLLQIDTDLPVILVTGHGDVPMAVQALRQGAYDFIEKPFTPERLLDSVRLSVTRMLMTVQVRTEEVEEAPPPRPVVQNVQYHHANYEEALGSREDEAQQPMRASPKIGRNDPCPCGSGKKYKQCHGKLS